MLIEITSNLFGWLPNAQWTSTIAGKEENWNNSSFNILFGSNDSWTIGLGRNTHVIGPDLKVIADWTYLETKLIGFFGGAKLGPKLGGVIFGSGGATDVILGDKGLLNYYGQNFTAERKSGPKFEYKDEKGLPLLVSVPLLIGFVALSAAIIAARVVYMTTRDPQHLAVRILKSAVPVLETRWVGLIQGIEKGLFAASEVEKIAKKTLDDAEVALAKTKAFSAAIVAISPRLINHPGLSQVVKKKTEDLATLTKDLKKKAGIVVDELADDALLLV